MATWRDFDYTFGYRELTAATKDTAMDQTPPANDLRVNTFELDADQRQVLDAADAVARAEFAPLAQRMDDEEWWPPEVFPRLGELGYLGVTVPETLGGAGMDVFTSGLVAQAFARWNHAVALSYVAHENLCLNNLYRNGTEEQRRQYLPGLCDGSSVGALALTEPGAGSDALGSMRTRARRDGDDYLLDGRKLYITNGPIADVLLVYARTEPQAGAHGISAFIVERGMPGFSVAQKLTKMGYRGSPTAELVFDQCRVPARNRVGDENAGVSVVMSGLDLERAVVAPLCLGVAERALELSLDYARTREQFGKPIARFQLMQAKLADMYVAVETMRTFVYRVLAASNEMERGGGGRGQIHALTAASILYAANTCSRVVDSAVQIHGGSGYMWESEVNRLYRSAKLLEIGAGTTEVRQLIIAGEMLR